MLLFLVLEQLNPRGRMAMSIKLKRRIYRMMFLKLCLINEEGLPRLYAGGLPAETVPEMMDVSLILPPKPYYTVS